MLFKRRRNCLLRLGPVYFVDTTLAINANSSVQFRHSVRAPGTIVHTQVPGRNTYIDSPTSRTTRNIEERHWTRFCFFLVESPGWKLRSMQKLTVNPPIMSFAVAVLASSRCCSCSGCRCRRLFLWYVVDCWRRERTCNPVPANLSSFKYRRVRIECYHVWSSSLSYERISVKRAIVFVSIHVVGCEVSLHPCLQTGVEALLASYLFPGFSVILTVHYWFWTGHPALLPR